MWKTCKCGLTICLYKKFIECPKVGGEGFGDKGYYIDF